MEKKQMSLGVLFIFGVLLLLILIKDLGYIFTGEAANINELSQEDIKVGKHVEAELYYCIDWYAELTTKSRRGGRTVTYHAVGVLEDGSLVSICTRKASDEYYKIEDLINASQQYLSGETNIPPEPVVISGTVRKIDSEIRNYYDSAVWYLQYDSDDVIYFDIDTSQKRIFSILIFAASLIMIILPIFALVAEYKESKRKRIERLNFVPSNHNDDDPIFNNRFYEAYKNNKDDTSIMDTDSNSQELSIDKDEYDNSIPKESPVSNSGKFKLKDD